MKIFKEFFEKIFKRKELRESKLDASFLRDRVKLLTSGDSVALDQHERRLILLALEFKPFAAEIQMPATKFYIRGLWRRIREKIKLIDQQYKTDKTEAKK